MQQISVLIGTRKKDVSANRRSKVSKYVQGKKGKYNIANITKQDKKTCLRTGEENSVVYREKRKKGKYVIANRAKQITFNRKISKFFLTNGTLDALT